MELYRLEHLTFTYPAQSVPALRDVSLTLRAGEFVTLCGLSGSGKSTLLRQLKTALVPSGTRTGAVFFDSRPLDAVSAREQASRIGLVQQSIENQLVTDKVWHELAFGLESLGFAPETIRRRVAEMAAFFDLEPLFHRDVASLSGGQKQLVSLAAVLTMQPDVLLLDEPTARLDPLAASNFLAALARVNRELGTTVLLSEQRLEEALPLSDRALVLSEGRLLADGAPREVGAQLRAADDEMFLAMPAAMRVWAAVANDAPCPVSVREGRSWLADYAAAHPLGAVPAREETTAQKEVAAALDGVFFRYEPDAPDVLRDLSLSVHRGELLALLGGNGAGKSTALRLLARTQIPQRGTVSVHGRTALLPQESQLLFAQKTVRAELAEVCAHAALVEETVSLCRLHGLLDRHPYDLSGGEQQRAALAKLLLTRPDLLLLDEPTAGLDAAFKSELADLLARLCAQGTAIVMVSHDLEFCAEHAARCTLLFDGGIVTDAPPRAFFSGSRFYTTAVNRIARGLAPDAVTVSDLIAACGGTPMAKKERRETPPLEPPSSPAPAPESARPASHRALLSCVLSCLLPILTLLLGLRFLGDRNYYLLSLLIVCEAMLPFFLLFERRRPAARELVVLAALCALGVAGRIVFFMFPQCKPALALVVLTGAALGGEAGFLIGAMTMLVSNLYFSQGPWTPWQMLAMGLCGFLAGLLFRTLRLPRTRWTLCIFGALSALTVYGPLLNASTALLATGTLSWAGFLAYCASGFSMDAVHAAATFAFLWLFSVPMLEKLERVRRKYGLPF